ncbi:MAG: RlpA-like double-psi beta-barrel domain-containing protein [Solirubrobacteraceae bacterium]
MQTGHAVTVSGRLSPVTRNVIVKLFARRGRHWQLVGRSRAHRAGRFRIRYQEHGVGSTRLRVSAIGPRLRPGYVPAGEVLGLAPSVASWYYDAGNTACGFHAWYGVANRTLPCGTKVTIRYGGRVVVATVDDRGPFIYGRSFDLNQNTARALGMYGVAQVLTSV